MQTLKVPLAPRLYFGSSIYQNLPSYNNSSSSLDFPSSSVPGIGDVSPSFHPAFSIKADQMSRAGTPASLPTSFTISAYSFASAAFLVGGGAPHSSSSFTNIVSSNGGGVMRMMFGLWTLTVAWLMISSRFFLNRSGGTYWAWIGFLFASFAPNQIT
jgi:hypothetical protein